VFACRLAPGMFLRIEFGRSYHLAQTDRSLSYITGVLNSLSFFHKKASEYAPSWHRHLHCNLLKNNVL